MNSKIKRAVKNPNKTVKGLYWKMDQYVGKTLFGNTVGLKHNILGKMNLVENSSFKSDDPIIKQFRKNGFLDLGIKFDESLIDKIRIKYNKMIEDDKFSFGSGGIANEKYFKRQIINPQFNIPEVESILNEEIINYVQCYYGGNFHVVRVDLWRIYHIPEKYQNSDLISNRWHCDNRKTDRLKLFVNLSDVSEKDGPLHLQSIPRTKELMKMKFNNRLDYGIPDEVMEDPKYVVRCIGPAGSTFFANTTTCLHKAGNPQNTRDIIQLLFRSSKEPFDKDWINRVIHVGPDQLDTIEE